MKQMKYEEGPQSVSVILPTRVLAVEVGDTVEVDAAEAALLASLPGWKAVKNTNQPETKES